MEHRSYPISSLLLVITISTLVFVVAHQHTFSNHFMINDDLRQQTYWMQQWIDPQLYQNDLLTQYARNYVPWGVQAINYLGAKFMNPLDFSKLLTGLLFVITAVFLFGLGLQFEDELTPYLVVCAYTLLGSFLMKIAGGISQSFVFPLLTGYLFFMSRDNLWGASLLILIQSLFTPYCFLLCGLTHFFYLIDKHRAALRDIFVSVFMASRGKLRRPAAADQASRYLTHGQIKSQLHHKQVLKSFLLSQTPILLGGVFMALKYVVFRNPQLGELVNKTGMVGHAEYSSAGRYELYPIPSILNELIIEPWLFNAPFTEHGPIIAWIYIILITALVLYAIYHWDHFPSAKGFHIFKYLAPASFVLYFAARMLYLKLFIPGRYLDYSVNIFYCLALAFCLRTIIEAADLKRCAIPIVAALLLFGAIRLHNTGVFDYSRNEGLYRYIQQNTPKEAILAGHPYLMDDVLTFGKRSVFVSYELSHPWIQPYWNKIKQRTLDLFSAYYADDPEVVKQFAGKNNIDYFVVRESDFKPEMVKEPRYFAPFPEFIKNNVQPDKNFALLNPHEFPPVFQSNGIRVVKLSR